MEPNKSKHISHNRTNGQHGRHSAKMRRLSSFSQLTKAFPRRRSRTSLAKENLAEADFIPMTEFNSASAKEPSNDNSLHSIPNFSLPMSVQARTELRTTFSSQSNGLLPRSYTFSHLPSVKSSHVSSNSPVMPLHSTSFQNRISRISPQRSFLPVMACPSPRKDFKRHNEVNFRRGAINQTNSIREAPNHQSKSTATSKGIGAIESNRESQNFQSASKPFSGSRTAFYNDPVPDSPFRPLNSRSVGELNYRHEHTFQSSAYWTGRFMTLNDIYMNNCWRDKHLFDDLENEEKRHALDVLRCRAVFAAMEEICDTSEAREDLNRFRQQYAAVNRIPELVDEAPLLQKHGSGIGSQKNTQETSSVSSQGTGLNLDLDETPAVSSVSTASSRSYNQMPLDFKFPPPNSPLVNSSVKRTVESDKDPSSPDNFPPQSSRNSHKNRRSSFIEKFIGKNRRSSVIES